jgi:hypothetical protein
LLPIFLFIFSITYYESIRKEKLINNKGWNLFT